MQPRTLFLILALFYFLSGCSSSPNDAAPEPTEMIITQAQRTATSLITKAPTFTTTIKPTATAVRTNKASSTATQTPTPEATRTSTPQPTLVSHTWQLENILLQVEPTGGDGGYWEVDPPRLVLYSNGLLLIPTYEYGRTKMMGRTLSRVEMCALFNTLDQVGFLDYDHSVYMDPMDGLGGTRITVNIWKKQQVYGQVLDWWIYEGGDWWYKECPTRDCLPPPVILPALSNAYKLLDRYNPGGLVEIPAEKLVLWAFPDESDRQPVPWPVKEISLEEIAQKATEEYYFAVYLDNPTIVHALQEKGVSGLYTQGGVKRRVSVRPLWPGETHFGMHFPGLPTAAPLASDGTTMSCSPEDGLLPVPE